MPESEPNEIIRDHLRRFFVGRKCEEHVWTLGPAHAELPRLRIAEFAPSQKDELWAYATIGAWEACTDPRLEFLAFAPQQDSRHVELLMMSAWYHGKHRLGTGHTFPIGEPWLCGSKCRYFLVSTPYPLGAQFEVCNFADWHLHFLWLLPITESERELKIREGLEALEQRFEACGLEYWKPNRDSVV
jgi:Suppressor of fused protein (SUFU)